MYIYKCRRFNYVSNYVSKEVTVYKQYSRRKNTFHKNGLIKAKYVSTNNQVELSRQHKSANCNVSSTLPPAFYSTKVNDITLQCSFGLFHPDACYSPWLIPIVVLVTFSYYVPGQLLSGLLLYGKQNKFKERFLEITIVKERKAYRKSNSSKIVFERFKFKESTGLRETLYFSDTISIQCQIYVCSFPLQTCQECAIRKVTQKIVRHC